MKKKKGFALLLAIIMAASFVSTQHMTVRASSPEPGNGLATAAAISLNTAYKGRFTADNRKDLYKFTLHSSGQIAFSLEAKMYSLYCYIYDSDGNALWRKQPTCNSTTETINTAETIDLTKGTYYFSVCSVRYTGNYSFRLSFTAAKESFSEAAGGSNNDTAHANTISLNKSYKGHLAINDSADFYKFTVKKSTDFAVNAAAQIPHIHYRIYNQSGREIWRRSPSWNQAAGENSLAGKVTLAKGSYYFAAERYSSYTGSYSFKLHSHSYKTAVTKATVKKNGYITKKCSCGQIKSKTTLCRPKKMTLSKTAYVYNGKAKKPSVTIRDSRGKIIRPTNYKVSYASGRKRPGTYKVTVKFKGNYKGTMSKTFKIKARR